MANIKTSKQPLFQQPTQAPNRVGNDMAARRAYLAQGGGAVTPSTRTAPKPLYHDHFQKGGNPKPADNITAFNPKAVYHQAKMRFAGPYRPAAVDHLENGTRISKPTNTQPLDDNDRLRILNIVSNNPKYATQKAVWSYVSEAGETSKSRETRKTRPA